MNILIKILKFITPLILGAIIENQIDRIHYEHLEQNNLIVNQQEK